MAAIGKTEYQTTDQEVGSSNLPGRANFLSNESPLAAWGQVSPRSGLRFISQTPALVMASPAMPVASIVSPKASQPRNTEVGGTRKTGWWSRPPSHGGSAASAASPRQAVRPARARARPPNNSATITQHVSRKLNGPACGSPYLALMKALDHSRTNRKGESHMSMRVGRRGQAFAPSRSACQRRWSSMKLAMK